MSGLTVKQQQAAIRKATAENPRLGAGLDAAVDGELQTLYAALDNVSSGLLILNRDLRAIYSNPALHRHFRSSSAVELRRNRPPYAELLERARQAEAIKIENYVEDRLAWVKAGDAKAVDMKMSDGTVLRCQLAVLPDGGRMLIYSDVTDIIRQAEELERLATTDGMTGIFNRRHFLLLADREWTRARRYGNPLSLLMLDIDYFKSINDKFGHHVGDQVIIHLAELAGVCKRDVDLLARIGGEEFALLLPETTLNDAQIAAERIRDLVAGCPTETDTQPVSTTVSIGVAVMTDAMTDFSELMKAADKALYSAKNSGRNRVAPAQRASS